MIGLLRKPRCAFTLVELIAVILIIVILAAIILSRIGNLRTAAFNADAQRLSKEYNKAVELIGANGGTVVDDVESYLEMTPAKRGSSISGDPYHLGLDSVTWHLSTTTSPDPGAILGLLRVIQVGLTTNAAAVELPKVGNLGTLLKYQNCDVVMMSNQGKLQSTVLVFQ
jgi:prepilin-type N-terminal cleavage/methylation domain-containing protein